MFSSLHFTMHITSQLASSSSAAEELQRVRSQAQEVGDNRRMDRWMDGGVGVLIGNARRD